jgi:hypothetical protein
MLFGTNKKDTEAQNDTPKTSPSRNSFDSNPWKAEETYIKLCVGFVHKKICLIISGYYP